jgi:hypothetical protein
MSQLVPKEIFDYLKLKDFNFSDYGDYVQFKRVKSIIEDFDDNGKFKFWNVVCEIKYIKNQNSLTDINYFGILRYDYYTKELNMMSDETEMLIFENDLNKLKDINFIKQKIDELDEIIKQDKIKLKKLKMDAL